MTTATATLAHPNNSVVAMCPRTGAILRAATPAEVAAYLAQPERRPLFRRPVRCTDVTLTESNDLPGNAPFSCGEN